MKNDLLYQVALTRVPQIGPVQARILVEHFGDAATIFKTRKQELAAVEGIGELKAKSIKDFTDFASAEEEIRFIEKNGIQPLFLTDEAYPRRLLHCYDPPTMLFYRGNADLNNTRVVSIIGTRSHTEYGRQTTESIVAALAPLNVLIVSGLAYGVDAIAHKAAVDNKLATVAVVAHGLDTIYPGLHRPLAKEILHNGGILTEFPQNTKPDKHNFPRRNRVVAGMADVTIVIETQIKGGSMITAELAYNYNRDVFAVPGRIGDHKSAGCIQLIQQNKAVAFSTVEHMLDVLGWQRKEQPRPSIVRELFIELSRDEQVLVDLLKDKDSVHIDEMYLRSNLTSSSVAAAILNLELQNVISALPGKMYRLN